MEPTEYLEILRKRFFDHRNRHAGLEWDDVLTHLNEKVIASILKLEETGGEPDIVLYEGQMYYVDFSKETPDRKSLCYDEEARVNRKKFPPESSAEEEAIKMGVELLTEELYRYIQTLEPVDLKTSSWLKTPNDVRDLGGAVFGDRRYNRVFVYHNGADSYYGARGFRAQLKL